MACTVSYAETCLCWPPLVPFNVAQFVRVANLWTPSGTMKIEPCTIICANVHFRVQRQVV